MIFQSFEFILFFSTVYLLYYLSAGTSEKYQNFVLLVSSLFFYGFAEWRILPVLVFAIIVFYSLGILSDKSVNEKNRQALSTLGIVAGVGMLLYFKYTNFFIESINGMFSSLGANSTLPVLNILLPLGISFFTFRLLSYIFDISRRKYVAEKDFVVFASYVSFFPSILSGPIDRPDGLIPQLKNPRKFNYDLTVNGLQQILWGAFKKIVVANNLAFFVDQVFGAYHSYSGLTLVIVALLYSFQMYADFSGYTDMALGIGKLLGLNMMNNFNYPLFAQNIADFWRRWHISLTSWLTDYVFMPLNIRWRHLGNLGMILAIMVDFLICGLWHGDNWTFVAWGTYHGMLYIPLIISGSMFQKVKVKTTYYNLPSITTFWNMVKTFLIVAFGLVLFRSESISDAGNYLYSIANNFSFDLGYFVKTRQIMLITLISFVGLIVMIVAEWRAFIQKREFVKSKRVAIIILVMMIVFMGSFKDQMSFIYFNF